MIVSLVATVSAGLFAGAALYVSAVEHPARMSCGPELALREFRPSYRRGTIMQAGLALLGGFTGLIASWNQRDPRLLVASLLLVSVVPFTLLFILPTNKQLLDPTLETGSSQAVALLTRWGHLHAARAVLGLLAFLVFLWRVTHG
jgi:hypothetical protein